MSLQSQAGALFDGQGLILQENASAFKLAVYA